ncbi:hypothetical protein BCR44DRAFT_1228377 [Catenaria anguillulae PL171]|uniref:Uncharacterized protein n=1 Tax=Catenaria anguillulae PL171 TaxID=765915 RepID=A0A1Y2HFS9_9FUNG|nr:hypothetical protein BCR44DRAFT_1228377 [Catenaria anguillulae PL171]
MRTPCPVLAILITIRAFYGEAATVEQAAKCMLPVIPKHIGHTLMWEPWSVEGYSDFFQEYILLTFRPTKNDVLIAKRYFESVGEPNLISTKMTDGEFDAFKATTLRFREVAKLESAANPPAQPPSRVDTTTGKRARKIKGKEHFAHEIVLYLQRLRRLMPSWENQYLTAEEREALGEYGKIFTFENPGYKTHSVRRFAAQLAARAGMANDELMVWGRWESDAVYRYIEEARIRQRKMQASKAIDPVRVKWMIGKPYGEEGLREALVAYLQALAVATAFLQSLSLPLVRQLRLTSANMNEQLSSTGILWYTDLARFMEFSCRHFAELEAAIQRSEYLVDHDSLGVPGLHPMADPSGRFALNRDPNIATFAPTTTPPVSDDGAPDGRVVLAQDCLVFMPQGADPSSGASQPNGHRRQRPAHPATSPASSSLHPSCPLHPMRELSSACCVYSVGFANGLCRVTRDWWMERTNIYPANGTQH